MKDATAPASSRLTSASTAATSSGSPVIRNGGMALPPETGGVRPTPPPPHRQRVGAVDVLAIEGVHQAARLLAEVELRPDVAGALDAVHLETADTGALAH